MESLRVMPPVPMTVRVAAKTDYIDGVLVPKGTLFYIPVRFHGFLCASFPQLTHGLDTGYQYLETDMG